MFITFEGVDGSGKTTLIDSLKTELEKIGKSVMVTREPGGTEIGKQLRSLILDPSIKIESEFTSLLLFMADRIEHVKSVIYPALDTYDFVLCDRYYDSTYAYQHYANGISEELIDELSSLVNLTPDLTILLDLSPEDAMKRLGDKSGDESRYEIKNLDFKNRIYKGYLERAKKYPERIKVIDGTLPPSMVTSLVSIMIMARTRDYRGVINDK